jgi:hypothetical protein
VIYHFCVILLLLQECYDLIKNTRKKMPKRSQTIRNSKEDDERVRRCNKKGCNFTFWGSPIVLAAHTNKMHPKRKIFIDTFPRSRKPCQPKGQKASDHVNINFSFMYERVFALISEILAEFDFFLIYIS